MSQLVTEAVKDAFIAVEEEAPGQGWRMMWNEMVTSNETPTLRPSDLDIKQWAIRCKLACKSGFSNVCDRSLPGYGNAVRQRRNAEPRSMESLRL